MTNYVQFRVAKTHRVGHVGVLHTDIREPRGTRKLHTHAKLYIIRAARCVTE